MSSQLVFAMTVGRDGPEDALVGQKVPVGQGLVGLAAQTHEVQIGVPTFHLPQDREQAGPSEEPRAEIAAPLIVNDTLIGVMTAVSFKADKRFSSADARLYARIAWVAGIVIDQRRRLAASSPCLMAGRSPASCGKMNVWTWKLLPQFRGWSRSSRRGKPGLPGCCRISCLFWRS